MLLTQHQRRRSKRKKKFFILKLWYSASLFNFVFQFQSSNYCALGRFVSVGALDDQKGTSKKKDKTSFVDSKLLKFFFENYCPSDQSGGVLLSTFKEYMSYKVVVSLLLKATLIFGVSCMKFVRSRNSENLCFFFQWTFKK